MSKTRLGNQVKMTFYRRRVVDRKILSKNSVEYFYEFEIWGLPPLKEQLPETLQKLDEKL